MSHLLVFESHRVIDRVETPAREKARALADGPLQGFVRHEGVDELAVEGLRDAPQSLNLDRALGLGLFERGNGRLADARPLRMLGHGHTQHFTDRLYPSAHRSRVSSEWPDQSETLIKAGTGLGGKAGCFNRLQAILITVKNTL